MFRTVTKSVQHNKMFLYKLEIFLLEHPIFLVIFSTSLSSSLSSVRVNEIFSFEKKWNFFEASSLPSDKSRDLGLLCLNCSCLLSRVKQGELACCNLAVETLETGDCLCLLPAWFLSSAFSIIRSTAESFSGCLPCSLSSHSSIEFLWTRPCLSSL